MSELVPVSPAQEEPKAPVYGTRADSPGPRGCWSLNKRGEPCSAARRADSDYCNAHSGQGVTSDPVGWGEKARRVSAENRRRRAALRLELGITRNSTARSLLRSAVFVERERLVAAALDGALDPELSAAQRSKTALELIREAEPQERATLDVPLDAASIDKLGLAELRALASQVQS